MIYLCNLLFMLVLAIISFRQVYIKGINSAHSSMSLYSHTLVEGRSVLSIYGYINYCMPLFLQGFHFCKFHKCSLDRTNNNPQIFWCYQWRRNSAGHVGQWPTHFLNHVGLAHPLLALLSFVFVLLITTDHQLFPGMAHPLSKSFCCRWMLPIISY